MKLAERLPRLPNPLVVALTASGIAIAIPIAERLDAPLNILLVDGLPSDKVAGRDLLLVDDGLDDGSAIARTLVLLEQQHPRSVRYVTPVLSEQSQHSLGQRVLDDVVLLYSRCPTDVVTFFGS